MSEQQIQQILKRLDQQDQALRIIQAGQAQMKEDLEPIHKMFDSVSGFNKISVWILKALVLFGAGLGVIYGALEWIRNK